MFYSLSYIKFPEDVAPECGLERIYSTEPEEERKEEAERSGSLKRPKTQYHGVRLVRKFQALPAVRSQESVEHSRQKPPLGFTQEEIEATLVSNPHHDEHGIISPPKEEKP